MWDQFRYTLQVFTRFCLDTSIVFAIITGNLITRSDTAISTNFVQSKTIQESLKHFFIIFMQQDNVFTKTENCHSAHICPQCRALSRSSSKLHNFVSRIRIGIQVRNQFASFKMEYILYHFTICLRMISHSICQLPRYIQ